MGKIKTPFKLKARITLNAMFTVLKKPRYIVIMNLAILFMAGAIVWSLNLDLLRYILLEAPLSSYDKLSFFSYTYESLFTTFDSAQSLGIVVFSLLFGINASLFVYVIRRRGFKAVPKKSSGTAFTLAILGGGCVACGTSLIAPLLATFGATSGVLVRELGAVFMWVGSILTIYSIYKLATLVQIKSFEDLRSA